jgi:DNA replication protein DnaC
MVDMPKKLVALGLRYLAEHYDDVIALATRQRMTPQQLLEYVLEQEHQDRARRGVQRRLTRSRLGRFKPIADFDWNWPKSIDRDLVESAMRLEFLEAARNIVLVSAQGLGKTTIAQNIAHQAILAGHSVLVVTASQLLLDLNARDSARALETRFRHYSNAALLVVDEVGYLPFDNRNADLLFQIVSRRYERKSIVLTTNLAFKEWNTVFPNAACTTALIDRLVHHSDIVSIEGDSYRLREAESSKASRPTPGKPATKPRTKQTA